VAFALEGPFRARVDAARVAVAGHSMGATCAIAAGAAAGPGAYRLVVAQHPGICGPFGPPPWPATWMPSDMRSLTSKFPLLMSTATNDGAFLPAPHTAPHEHGCYEKGANGTAAFVQFSEAGCTDDGAREPLVDDGGHDCPMKIGAPESPWVLVALKLYLLLDGDTSSTCHELLYGNATASLRRSPDADLVDIRGA
jgi:pimeloyl-ACP methyl ester carboxylesterase